MSVMKPHLYNFLHQQLTYAPSFFLNNLHFFHLCIGKSLFIGIIKLQMIIKSPLHFKSPLALLWALIYGGGASILMWVEGFLIQKVWKDFLPLSHLSTLISRFHKSLKERKDQKSTLLAILGNKHFMNISILSTGSLSKLILIWNYSNSLIYSLLWEIFKL